MSGRSFRTMSPVLGAPRTDGHLERLRRAELDMVRSCFRPGMHVLELGGGSGFQASIIASWGCEITSLDVATRPNPTQQYYEVTEYDGAHIPFPRASFTAVFSSNVLEHVKGVSEFCKEIRRVLVDDGIVVHVVPTSSWRFWTSLAHYPYLAKRLVGRSEVACAARVAPGAPVSDVIDRQGFGFLLRRALLSGAHGEYPNAVSELYYYSRVRWLRVFRDSGFEVTQVRRTGLFYTGYALCPSLSLEARRGMARVLGSACRIFVMRPR